MSPSLCIVPFIWACSLLLCGQSIDRTINLANPATAVSENAFGLAVDPDGRHAYVALAGDFDPNFPTTPATAAQFNNQRIAKIDILNGTVVATGQTGLFPEDVAITRDPSGQTAFVWVTNSTSGTVSLLDPALNNILDIPLTPCFGQSFASVFPFGILASPDGSQLFVGTLGACGTVDVIDADPLNATFATVVSSFSVPHLGGRMAWDGFPILLIAASDFGSLSAGFTRVDVTNPAGAAYFGGITDPGSFGFGPGVTDIAVRPNGNVVLPISFADAPRLIEMSPAGTLLQNIDLSSHVTGLALHGLGLAGNGEVAIVTDLGGAGEVTFVDLISGSVIGGLNLGTGVKPNEAVYSTDESRLLVSSQGAEEVLVLKDLPGHVFTLDLPPISPLGQTATALLGGLEWNQPAALYISAAGAGPQVIGGFTIYLTDPFVLLGAFTGGLHGEGSVSIPVPNAPLLSGVTFFLQGVTLDRDASIRVSSGVSSLLQ